MDTVYKLSSGTLGILTGDTKYIGLFVRGMTGESGEQTGMGRTWMTLTGGGTCLMSRN